MKGKRFHKLKKKIKTYNTKYIVLLFIITLIILGGILIARSKYALKSNITGIIDADTFYFNSYTLGENEKIINSNSIEFKLYNYEDVLRTSSADIEYEIKAEVISPTDITLTTKVTINGEERNTGTLAGKTKVEDNIKIEVKTTDGINIDNASVRVYAIAKEPYTKKMSAVYNVKSTENTDKYDVNLKSESEYENVLIRTYSYSGTLEISFDNTKLKVYDERKENVKVSENTVTVNVSESSNYSIKFIKLTSDEINLGQEISVNKK